VTEILVTQMTYQTKDKDTIVHIFGRTNKGNRAHVVLNNFESYFYTNDNPRDRIPPSHRHLVKRFDSAPSWKNLVNKPLYKVYARFPFDVPELKRFFPYHYEADVPFIDRVRFDLKIKHQIQIPDNKTSLEPSDIAPVERTINPEIACIDIETDDSHGFAKPEEGAWPVKSIAIYSSQLNKFILIIPGQLDGEKVKIRLNELYAKNFTDVCPDVVIQKAENESDMFSKFTKVFNKLEPDIITGWNIIGYDKPYLENRAAKMGFSLPKFNEYTFFDVQKGYEKLHMGKTYPSLEYAAQNELKTGKLQREKIHIMFEEDKEKLAVYNIWDVVLTNKIDQVKNVTNFHLNLAWFAGCGLEYTYGQEALVDKYMLHQTAGIVAVPSKDMLVSSGVDQGAYVKEGQHGLFKNVCVIDFASMYPYSVLSCNLSPETKVDKDPGDGSVFKLPSGRMYRKSPKGLVPMITEKLVIMRKQLKEDMKTYEKTTPEYKALWEQQRAVKYFTNAVYGVMGSSIFRLADGDVGSDITGLGRFLIHNTLEQVEKMGYKALYADTDSVLFQVDTGTIEEVVNHGLKVQKDLNDYYPKLAKTWNGEKECIHSIKLDKVYKAWFQPGVKKRYVGLVEWDNDTETKFLGHMPIKDRLDVKGFEIVRSNVAIITKEVQLEVISTALQKPEFKKEIITYLGGIRKQFFNGELNMKMPLPASWNKVEYKTKQAHIRAMEYSLACDLIDIQAGDAFKWLYVLGVSGHPSTDVAAVEFDIDQIPVEVKIDFNKMWQRNIVGPLDPVLEGLGITWDEIITGKTQKTISDWF
jgi:DNA polymerase I